MTDNLTQLKSELEQIEQALAAADGLPPAQRETILSALRTQRDALQVQITALAGSGAIAQDGGVAAGMKGVAVGGAVQGGVSITEVHYHTGDTIAGSISGPELYHNLPQPDYGAFIGREEELKQVHHLLQPYPRSQHAVVVIDGIGGIGKSTLALEVAHHYLHGYERLHSKERFEAIIWTSAKSATLTAEGIERRPQITRTLDNIYTTISVALRREDIIRARPEEQDELIRQALTQCRALLIIDNLETIDDERVNGFLRELPAPTKCIVTTRHRIDVAYPVRLTGMGREDGLALIVQECEKKKVTLTHDQADRLYRHTGGVPLPIVWSIAQMGHGYGVESVLRRLGTPKDDVARYCFEEAMNRIQGKPPHKLLMALSLFATDASREAVGYVADLPELDRDDGLVELEKLSLVNRDNGRFGVLPLTRTYVLSHLQSAGQIESENRDRWFSYFYSLLFDAKEREDSALRYRELEIELANLIGVMDWCLEQGDYQRAVDYYYKAGLDQFLDYRGFSVERVKRLQQAIEASQVLNEQDVRKNLALDLGTQYRKMADYEGALAYYAIGLNLAQLLEDKRAAAYALRSIGRTKFYLGQLDESIEYFDESRAVYQDMGDHLGLAIVGHHRARVFHRREEYDQAERLYLESLEIKREHGSLLDVAWTELELGTLACETGRYEMAEEYLDRARKAIKNIQHEAGLAMVDLRRGMLAQARGNFSSARRLFSNSREVFRRMRQLRRMNMCIQRLAELDRLEGREEESEAE